MATAKKAVADLLDHLPDDISLEEIQYHIYVRQKVEAGLADVAAGRAHSSDEVERRMGRWIAR